MCCSCEKMVWKTGDVVYYSTDPNKAKFMIVRFNGSNRYGVVNITTYNVAEEQFDTPFEAVTYGGKFKPIRYENC